MPKPAERLPYWQPKSAKPETQSSPADARHASTGVTAAKQPTERGRHCGRGPGATSVLQVVSSLYSSSFRYRLRSLIPNAEAAFARCPPK
jgi:hypothetical protein